MMDLAPCATSRRHCSVTASRCLPELGRGTSPTFGLSGLLVLSASTYIEDTLRSTAISVSSTQKLQRRDNARPPDLRFYGVSLATARRATGAKSLPNLRARLLWEKWGASTCHQCRADPAEQKQALVDLCKHWQVPVSAL